MAKAAVSTKNVTKNMKAWNHEEKECRIDVMRYLAKYDFDVARKICPLKGGVEYTEC